jgi:hypothetical protein
VPLAPWWSEKETLPGIEYAGDLQVILVASKKVAGDRIDPNTQLMSVSFTKDFPSTVTSVPPDKGPDCGEIDATAGVIV